MHPTHGFRLPSGSRTSKRQILVPNIDLSTMDEGKGIFARSVVLLPAYRDAFRSKSAFSSDISTFFDPKSTSILLFVQPSIVTHRHGRSHVTGQNNRKRSSSPSQCVLSFVPAHITCHKNHLGWYTQNKGLKKHAARMQHVAISI